MNDVPTQGACGFLLPALVVLLGIWAAPLAAQPAATIPVSEARASTNAATRSSNAWEGPATAPRAQPRKTISLVVEDLGNGGVLGFAQGVREAVRVIDWTVKLFGGTPVGWTHALAINDIYFDYAVPTLVVSRLPTARGWQAVDELNRLFAGQPITNFVAPVHLVTSENIERGVGPDWVYDPPNGYRDAYRHIWRGK